MNLSKAIRKELKQIRGIKDILKKVLFLCITFACLTISCDSDPYGSHWNTLDNLTISQYLEKNKEEFSDFYSLLEKGKLLSTLSAYNPYGDDYTLFLPTNEAIDRFLEQNNSYGSLEELLKDTSFIKTITRYHTLNKKLHTDEFPDGALADLTLTGNRLVTTFYANGDNPVIKVNNYAEILKPNLEMTNGYIHVISDLLQPSEITGYYWLQTREDFSILAQAMKLSGVNNKIWWDKYTIFAEHDSVFYRYGINNVDDLISRIASPGMALSDKNNTFYLFTAYHIVGGEFYLNDLNWGSYKYTTLATSKPLMITVGLEIKINHGVDVYGINVSETGSTTEIDYISPVWEESNIMTRTGPVHTISDFLFYDPMPWKN